MTSIVSLRLRRPLLCLAVVLLAVLNGAATGKVLIVQTNAAGDNIHLIDPATNEIVGEITGIEVPHGVAAAPDGGRLYITNESRETVDVVDGETLKVIKQVPLTGRPNNIAIGKDGRRVYAAVAQAPGAVDVIDTASLERVKSIAVKGAVHNTYVTPDGKFVVAGSIAGRNMTVIDAKTDEVAWMLSFENGVRPIAFETNPDGSTKRAFVQISNFHGFFVIDWAQRKEVARITLPEIPVEKRHLDTLQGSPSHGIGVTPDGKSLWGCSKINSHIYGYSLPDLKLLGGVQVGDHPDWLTFTPDSQFVYVANAGSNSVSAVDIAARKEVTRIKVGQVPKRVITAVLLARTSSWSQPPDFRTFRAKVEPIFMQPRPGNSVGPGGSCFVCHTKVTSRLKLQPLATGATGWTEEESRKNYAAVLRLVVPGDPLKSRLLLHPLAADAGGDPSHAGGKYWASQEAGEFQTIAAWVRSGSAGATPPAARLDYETFRTKIQPILLRKRPGSARCVTCHARANNFLQALVPATTEWTDEQSRQNFDAITARILVVPGDPLSSRLLMMPLAHEAGGDPFHPGGKHWESQKDPEWETMAAWIRGRD